MNVSKPRHLCSLRQPDRFWQTVGLCALTAALFFLPFYLLDGGFSSALYFSRG